MTKKNIKTVLIDDDPRAINRMKVLLSNFTEIELLGETTEPEEGIDLVLRAKPDLVFLDVEMPGKSGLEVAGLLNRSQFSGKIIFVSSYDHYAIPAIKNDAFDYLLKPVSIDDLKSSIERFKGKINLSLSKKEIEVVRLLAEGMNSNEIAGVLDLSRHTVDTHRRNILEKTECKNTAELIKFAALHHLL
ncbi:MAG: response regulator transcription factor [Lutimonas sp.]